MDFSVDESPAAKALGPLFKLTEVHLWDDDSSEVVKLSHVPESIKLGSDDKDCGRTNGSCSLPEDVPLSSRTNKDIMTATSSGEMPQLADYNGSALVDKSRAQDVVLFRSPIVTSVDVVPDEIPSSISKYWLQRYLLFSRFDNGIKMDDEGWFSVTPEILAKHHAVRCGRGAVVDLFTGVGGNAIQFAQRSRHVIAIDIDPIKIDYARHNAAVYGVDERIDFIKGDSFSLAPKLKADVVFCSPPWGGPGYSKVTKFDINTMLKPRDGKSLFDAGRRIAPKIVMFLPKNVDINQLAELSLSAMPPWSLEVEKNYLNGVLKTVTAYFCDPSTSL